MIVVRGGCLRGVPGMNSIAPMMIVWLVKKWCSPRRASCLKWKCENQVNRSLQVTCIHWRLSIFLTSKMGLVQSRPCQFLPCPTIRQSACLRLFPSSMVVKTIATLWLSSTRPDCWGERAAALYWASRFLSHTSLIAGWAPSVRSETQRSRVKRSWGRLFQAALWIEEMALLATLCSRCQGWQTWATPGTVSRSTTIIGHRRALQWKSVQRSVRMALSIILRRGSHSTSLGRTISHRR